MCTAEQASNLLYHGNPFQKIHENEKKQGKVGAVKKRRQATATTIKSKYVKWKIDDVKCAARNVPEEALKNKEDLNSTELSFSCVTSTQSKLVSKDKTEGWNLNSEQGAKPNRGLGIWDDAGDIPDFDEI